MAVPSQQHQQRHESAAYVLRLTEHGAGVPVPDNPLTDSDGALRLPIPPQSLRPQQAARIGFMETSIGATVDEQGAGPPSWELSGQFLVGPVRVNGRVLDHHDQQRAIEAFVRFYLSENKQRALAQDALIRMEFHDFYADEHWFVAPLTVPLGERDSARPLVERWSLRLRALEPTTIIEPPDASVEDALLADPNREIARVCPIEAAA